jgi:hypothetical protein
MSQKDLRQRLQEAVALIDTDPNQAKKDIWDLFKDIEKPEVRTEKIIVQDRTAEQALQSEIARLKDQVQQKELALKQLEASLQQTPPRQGYDVDMIREVREAIERAKAKKPPK